MSSRTYISSEKKVRSKKRKRFLSRTHSLGSFLPVRILSLISIKTTEGHMWNWIIFYFIFLKRKNEMKRDENETLCWIMRWGWMTWKRSLAFNNDDGKNCTKKFWGSISIHCPKINLMWALRDLWKHVAQKEFS